jgi:hypothetical protein
MKISELIVTAEDLMPEHKHQYLSPWDGVDIRLFKPEIQKKIRNNGGATFRRFYIFSKEKKKTWPNGRDYDVDLCSDD